jgi:hypothetical protein
LDSTHPLRYRQTVEITIKPSIISALPQWQEIRDRGGVAVKRCDSTEIMPRLEIGERLRGPRGADGVGDGEDVDGFLEDGDGSRRWALGGCAFGF